MAFKYLAQNSPMYKSSQGNNTVDKLIYGEEVEVLDQKENGRTKVRFRSKAGWIKSQHLSSDPALEIYFIDVGQGDSTFLVTPGRKKILVDGGENDRALRFLAWKYRLEDPAAQQVTIDLLVLTHADEDHIKGLVHVISHPKIKIKKIIHSGLATFKAGIFAEKLGDISTVNGAKYLVTSHNHLDELDDAKLATNFFKWKQAITEDGDDIDYTAVNSSTGFIDIGDPKITIEVVGPKLDALPGSTSAYRWFDDHSHTINGHSVVLRVVCGDVAILLAGDLNTDGEDHLLQDPQTATKMDAHVLKAPHHGSHEFSRKWLDAVNPQISVISSGDDTDHGHPRAVFLGAMGNSSRQPAYIFSTEIAANFVKMEEELGRGTSDDSGQPLREMYKRRLHGMINVRTNGKTLYAARRVASSYMWEYYVIDKPAARSK
jgi:beta-lactamase superfamily II metal-dependent hydrolase